MSSQGKMPVTKAFKELSKSVKHQYLGKTVPREYRNKYGSRYSKKDVRSLSYAIAKAKGVKIH